MTRSDGLTGKGCLQILVTNDDGVDSVGVTVLTQRLHGHSFHIDVVTPARQYSGASRSHTFHRDLSMTLKRKEAGLSIWVLEGGTPVDCVLAAEAALGPHDLVLSGINHGANLGDHVYYSGTVGAALEAGRLGIPGIAVSLATEREQGSDANWDTAARVIQNLLVSPTLTFIPRETVLNVNVPNLLFAEVKGWQVCDLAPTFGYSDAVQCNQIDSTRFSIANVWGEVRRNGDSGSDIAAVQSGYVAITPLVVRPYSQITHRTQISLPHWSLS
jgi:5'-nucleotidase